MDGTLLPLDTDRFIQDYTKTAYEYFASHFGQDLTLPLYGAMAAMLKGHPGETNAHCYYRVLEETAGISMPRAKEAFNAFCSGSFRLLRGLVSPNPHARPLLALLAKKQLKAVLATNPALPEQALRERMGWVGLAPEDFSHVSTFEQYHAVKPSPAYFTELLSNIGLQASQCLMVGNDPLDDLSAYDLGFTCFYLTEHPVRRNMPVRAHAQGGYPALLQYIEELP